MLPSVSACPIAMPYATLSAWRDHELPAAQAQQAQDHIQGCAACQHYLADLDLTGQAVRRHTPPAYVHDTIWRAVRPTWTNHGGPMTKSQKTLALTGIGIAAIMITLFTVVFVTLAHKPATTQRTPTRTPAASASPLVAVLLPNGDSGLPTSSLVGYDGATGHVRFTHVLPGSTFNTLVATQNLIGVIVAANNPSGSLNSSLQEYSAAGTQVRQIPLGSLGASLLLASQDTFFVGGSDYAGITKATSTPNTPPLQIIAIAADSGTQRWKQTVANATAFDHFGIVGTELVGFVSNASGLSQLTAFNVATGRLDWQVSFDTNATIISGGDTVYSLTIPQSASPTGKAGQNLVAYTAATGVVRWHQQFTPDTPLASSVSFIAADQQSVYYTMLHTAPTTASLNTLVALAASDGKQRWSVPGAGFNATQQGPFPPIVNGVLYTTNIPLSSYATAAASHTYPTNMLVGVQVATGATLWSAPLVGSLMTTPLVANTAIYFGVQTRSPSGSPGNTAIAAFSTTGSPLWLVQTPAVYISQLVMLP